MRPLQNFITLSAALFMLSHCSVTYCQTTHFKKYTNLANKFSFDISVDWTIKYSKEQDGLICVPTKTSEKEAYKDCFEGIVFRLDIYTSNLDSTLTSYGYEKINATYYTSDRINDSVKCKNINGSNWKGIYHENVCGISCNDTGFHPAAGRCEFIYFSNNRITICINTNGREFDDNVLKKIITSFHFN